MTADTRLGLDLLTRIAQHAIVVADGLDQIVEWSPGAEDLFGYPASDMLGQPLARLIAPSDRGAFEAEIARTRRAVEQGGRFVLSGQKEDGRAVSLEISLAAWSAGSQQMLGAVLHDVSKQVLAERRLGETETHWRDIAENSSDVLLLLDCAGTIIFANRSPLTTPLDQVIGSNLAELVPDLAPVIEPALQAVFESGVSYQHEGRIAAADGQTHWWWCRFAPQREDGDVVRAVLSISDIGDRRALQDALQKAKSMAEAANQLESEFLANMSHEVRTPLNGVVGVVDLLRSTRLTPEQEGYVTTLLEASRALRVVVDDLLDFSKIEAGQLRIEHVEFDLLALAASTIDMFRQSAVENDTALRLTPPEAPPPPLIGDPNRLRQVLSNLLANAVKFTKQGGIDLRIAVRDEGGAAVAVRIEIEDTGVGIAPEAQSLIFQPFVQADGSITRRFGGTGLGLSICRKLVSLMGGRIDFRSEAGVGSTFWFELELDKATSVRRAEGDAAALRVESHGAGGNILVAEDNSINQKVISAMLKRLGCSVDIAQNGREALELWAQGAYDLMLMDCQMPVMSGYEVAAAIRERERAGTGRIPIVAMTAQAYADDRERCARAGMDDHLAKPLTLRELQSVLAKWLPRDGTPASPAAPAPNCATVDLALLENLEAELGAEGHQIVAGLIEGFLTDVRQALDRIDQHVEAARWDGVAFEAHRLRSSTAILAALNMARLCQELEECAQRADAPLSIELAARLKAEFPGVDAALTAFARRPLHHAARQPRQTPEATCAEETDSVPS